MLTAAKAEGREAGGQERLGGKGPRYDPSVYEVLRQEGELLKRLEVDNAAAEAIRNANQASQNVLVTRPGQPKPQVLGIGGFRGITEPALIDNFLREAKRRNMVVAVGDADGIDAMVRLRALQMGVPLIVYAAGGAGAGQYREKPETQRRLLALEALGIPVVWHPQPELSYVERLRTRTRANVEQSDYFFGVTHPNSRGTYGALGWATRNGVPAREFKVDPYLDGSERIKKMPWRCPPQQFQKKPKQAPPPKLPGTERSEGVEAGGEEGRIRVASVPRTAPAGSGAVSGPRAPRGPLSDKQLRYLHWRMATEGKAGAEAVKAEADDYGDPFEGLDACDVAGKWVADLKARYARRAEEPGDLPREALRQAFAALRGRRGPAYRGMARLGALGGAVKAIDLATGRIGAYAVLFGDAERADISQQRDWFTKATEYWLDAWGERRPMLYHHCQDEATGDQPVVGHWDSWKMDDVGIWFEGQIDLAHKYGRAIQRLVELDVLKLSSDCAPQLSRRKPHPNGTNEVERWPIIAVSLTPTPAEPRLGPARTL